MVIFVHVAVGKALAVLGTSLQQMILGYALACLRAGVRTLSMRTWNDKIADIARQMGAELVRRPS